MVRLIRFGVLIVSRDASLRRDIGRFFRNLGCQAYLAPGQEEGVDIFVREDIKLVLSDCLSFFEALKVATRKKEEGAGLARRILAHLGIRRSFDFVLMDDCGSEVSQLFARGEGIHSFLKKPVERKELEVLITELGISKILSEK